MANVRRPAMVDARFAVHVPDRDTRVKLYEWFNANRPTGTPPIQDTDFWQSAADYEPDVDGDADDALFDATDFAAWVLDQWFRMREVADNPFDLLLVEVDYEVRTELPPLGPDQG